jgi:hypothetical protein
VPKYVSRPGRRAGVLGALIVALGGAAGARAAATRLTGLPVRAALLGDSYTFGVGATQPTDGYAYLVAKDENWTARVVGLPGSGYVRVAIRDGKNIAAGLSAVVAALPDAKIVVVGPIWLNGYPDAKALYVRHAIHMAQERISGTLWIDPIAQRWFTGSWTTRTGDDATMINYAAGHPNNLGYARIAKLLEADLQTLGVHGAA